MDIKKTTDVIDFYNQYAKRQKLVGINSRHKSILRKSVELGLRPDDHVLEVGCGIGTLTQLLIRYLKKGMLYSIDIGDENIKIANEKLGYLKNLKLELQDATNFYIDYKFDAIIMPDVIEHIPVAYHAQMFQNLSKMLKPHGFIYIHIPNPHYLEWLHVYKKELLQVIDQPIHLNEFIQNIAETNLYVVLEEPYILYSIYNGRGADYTHRVLKIKPIPQENSYIPIVLKKDLLNKSKRKIRIILEKIFHQFFLYYKKLDYN
jgi:2-polyprenyl-3-methyl-5-hydroxy-6-metoxy-1,4-benzoquinol methylase